MENNILTLESALNMPAMKLPVTTTLVRDGNRVIMISPFPKIKDFQKEIENFGKPTDIVAPNGFHHLGINRAKRLFPDAKLWAPPILKSKRSDIEWDGILPSEWPYGDVLSAYHLEGMPKVDEVLFYHKSSKTLIVADFCFNLIHAKGFGSWFFFKLFDTYRKFAVSRFFMFFVKNKQKFRSVIEKILDLDIDTIIVAHGPAITRNAKDQLRAALRKRGVFKY